MLASPLMLLPSLSYGVTLTANFHNVLCSFTSPMEPHLFSILKKAPRLLLNASDLFQINDPIRNSNTTSDTPS